MKRTTLSPAQARSDAAMARLNEDNRSTLSGWILLNGKTVIISQQKGGENRTGKVELPASEFKRLAEWYLKPQRLKAKRS